VAPVFAGINLEDISAPRCFEIEARLRKELTIPVFHDDQHCTAIVTLAALTNALRVVEKRLPDVRIVMSGAGAAGTAILALLMHAGARDVVMCDVGGVVEPSRPDIAAEPESTLYRVASTTNPRGVTGTLRDALVGADVFIGVSAPRILNGSDIATMADDAVVFAMANPDPEVDPVAAAEHAAVVATGRSDFANQINNVLAFPGVFRGALDVRASGITENMKLAAADAIAAVVGDDLSEECVIPSVFDERVGPSVAVAVAKAAREDGVARR
jgi:malate dehydrogenase (oxaloacetate-decarboxylating)